MKLHRLPSQYLEFLLLVLELFLFILSLLILGSALWCLTPGRRSLIELPKDDVCSDPEIAGEGVLDDDWRLEVDIAAAIMLGSLLHYHRELLSMVQVCLKLVQD